MSNGNDDVVKSLFDNTMQENKSSVETMSHATSPNQPSWKDRDKVGKSSQRCAASNVSHKRGFGMKACLRKDALSLVCEAWNVEAAPPLWFPASAALRRFLGNVSDADTKYLS